MSHRRAIFLGNHPPAPAPAPQQSTSSRVPKSKKSPFKPNNDWLSQFNSVQNKLFQDCAFYRNKSDRLEKTVLDQRLKIEHFRTILDERESLSKEKTEDKTVQVTEDDFHPSETDKAKQSTEDETISKEPSVSIPEVGDEVGYLKGIIEYQEAEIKRLRSAEDEKRGGQNNVAEEILKCEVYYI